MESEIILIVREEKFQGEIKVIEEGNVTLSNIYSHVLLKERRRKY